MSEIPAPDYASIATRLAKYRGVPVYYHVVTSTDGTTHPVYTYPNGEKVSLQTIMAMEDWEKYGMEEARK